MAAVSLPCCGHVTCERRVGPERVRGGRDRGTGPAEVLRLGFEVVLVAMGRAWTGLRVLEIDAVADGLVFGIFTLSGDLGGDEGRLRTILFFYVILTLSLGSDGRIVHERLAGADAVIS